MVEIVWSQTSENDLNEIIDYITQDSLEYALSFYEEDVKRLNFGVQAFLQFHNTRT